MGDREEEWETGRKKKKERRWEEEKKKEGEKKERKIRGWERNAEVNPHLITSRQ